MRDALISPCCSRMCTGTDLPPAIMSNDLSPLSSQATKAQHVYTLAAVAFDCNRVGSSEREVSDYFQ